MIYNRWGKMIFFAKDPFKGWDGTINAIEQPAGAYVWVCNYQLAGQPLHMQKGTVTLTIGAVFLYHAHIRIFLYKHGEIVFK